MRYYIHDESLAKLPGNQVYEESRASPPSAYSIPLLNRDLGIFAVQSNPEFWKKAILSTRSAFFAGVAMAEPAAGIL